jgi:hypothetical protein
MTDRPASAGGLVVAPGRADGEKFVPATEVAQGQCRSLWWQPLVLTVTVVTMVVGGTLAPAAHIDRLADHALADQER